MNPSSALPGSASSDGPRVTRGPRLAFLDVLRGVAIILMIVNHTAHDWIGREMGWSRYWLVYGSLLLPAAIFLFLVGFCLPLPLWRSGHAVMPPFKDTWRRYVRRGIRIVLAGLLLNVLVSGPLAGGLGGRQLPWWTGGVLQTIGLAVIVAAAAMWIAPHRWARWMLLAASIGGYVVYWVSVPALARWSAEHPTAASVVFADFPPWPWVGASIIGLILGWWWLEARARGAAAERRYFSVAVLIGVVGVVGYLIAESRWPTVPRFGFPRDLMLNHHWTPGGVTALLVVGGVALLLAFTYWLTERRALRLRWLVVLGQTALMLYFVHQVIERTLVQQALGVQFHSWPAYWVANVAFVALCVAIGYGWLAVRRRVLETAAAAVAQMLARTGWRRAETTP